MATSEQEMLRRSNTEPSIGGRGMVHVESALSTSEVLRSISGAGVSRQRRAGSCIELTGGQKLLIVMVGLPARGKSFIAHRLTNYLTWYGLETRVFNVGAYRRMVGGKEDAEFFDAGNRDAAARREELAWIVLNKLLEWLRDSGGDVAVFDATNTTDERRKKVQDHARKYFNDDEVKVLFIESICDDPAVLEANLEHKIAKSPDFVGMPRDQALQEFKDRITKYERVYRPITDDTLSYIKVMNLSSKIVCNKIHGRSQHRIVAFLMSLHVVERPVWLVRAGPVDTDPCHWSGSWHPGSLAHQMKSPHMRKQDSGESPPTSIMRGGDVSPLYPRQMRQEPSRGSAPPTVGRPIPHPPSQPNSSGGSVRGPYRRSNSGLSEGEGGEKDSSSEAEDEDGYWGGFSGIANWQKNAHLQTSADQYSWPNASEQPRSQNGGSMNSDQGDQDTLNLQIPQPSVLGATLNQEGKAFAERLGEFICKKSQEWQRGQPYVFTSTLPRAVETGEIVTNCSYGIKMESCSALNPVDVGACHGMTLAEIREMLGISLLEQMRKNPCEARLPGGESQQDVTKRLEPFIVDCLERQTSPVVIISHLSTLQILYDYFLGTGGKERDPFWALLMPQGSVIQLVPKFGGASAGVSWEQTRLQI